MDAALTLIQAPDPTIILFLLINSRHEIERSVRGLESTHAALTREPCQRCSARALELVPFRAAYPTLRNWGKRQDASGAA